MCWDPYSPLNRSYSTLYMFSHGARAGPGDVLLGGAGLPLAVGLFLVMGVCLEHLHGVYVPLLLEAVVAYIKVTITTHIAMMADP